jgi:hypothetical protein
VLTTGYGYVQAVLPASERLALGKVRELLGDGETIAMVCVRTSAAKHKTPSPTSRSTLGTASNVPICQGVV